MPAGHHEQKANLLGKQKREIKTGRRQRGGDGGKLLLTCSQGDKGIRKKPGNCGAPDGQTTRLLNAVEPQPSLACRTPTVTPRSWAAPAPPDGMAAPPPPPPPPPLWMFFFCFHGEVERGDRAAPNAVRLWNSPTLRLAPSVPPLPKSQPCFHMTPFIQEPFH